MGERRDRPVDVLILAVKETAGSALYGMVDVLSAAGNLWQTLMPGEAPMAIFKIQIVSTGTEAFTCGNDIPVKPHCAIGNDPPARLVILPELWLDPEESIHGRYAEIMDWIRRCYKKGMAIYSACSGSVMLAESGLLDGCEATSHWGYQDLFRRQYPRVRFRPEPNLVFADPAGRIVTAGGTTSWHDLTLHIIARYGNPGEALRIAQVYLMKWHQEGNLPFAPLVKRTPHADSVVRACEEWLRAHFREEGVIRKAVAEAGIPERTLKRRFKAATGTSLIDYLQNLRVEQAKRLLETGPDSLEDITVAVGYEDPSFFRRLFKRCTGLTPAQYRRMFRPIAGVSSLSREQRV